MVADKLSGRALVLDLVERAVIAIFFSAMAWSFLVSWQQTGNIVSLILLLSESSVVLFIVIRRSTGDVSVRPIDWLVAVLGTTAPLLVRPTGGGDALASLYVCVPLMLTGLALQIAAKLTLRRSFGVVAANRGVKVTGPYRLVRHPMYAGYLMTQLAFLLINPSAWNRGRVQLRHGLADRPHHGRGAGAWQRSVLPGLRGCGAISSGSARLLMASTACSVLPRITPDDPNLQRLQPVGLRRDRIAPRGGDQPRADDHHGND